jgi:Ca-activated chloride channel family protein
MLLFIFAHSFTLLFFYFDHCRIRYNNVLKAKGVSNRLVLVYPKEGTFWQTHPLCILDGPDWVTTDDQVASQLFVNYVSQTEQQSQLCKYGIRPYSSKAATASNCLGADPFTDANGVIPGLTTTDIPAIIDPSPRVVESVVQMWLDNRKPVKWIMVLDQSGSMAEGNKIGLLRQAAVAFINQMVDRDYLGIISFNSQVTTRLTLDRQLNASRVTAEQQIEQLEAFGNTELRAGLIQALDMMNLVIVEDRSNGGVNATTAYNYGVLVLTDGDDTSTRSVDDVYSRLPEGVSSSELHIFTIDLGSGLTGEDDVFMSEIATRTNGKRFDVSDASDLELTFTLIHAEL